MWGGGRRGGREGREAGSIYDKDRYVMGENPEEFAFVVENGDAEFEIV